MTEQRKIFYGFRCRKPGCGAFVLDQQVREGEKPDTTRLTKLSVRCRCGHMNEFVPEDLQREAPSS